jgi:hypothetical protein
MFFILTILAILPYFTIYNPCATSTFVTHIFHRYIYCVSTNFTSGNYKLSSIKNHNNFMKINSYSMFLKLVSKVYSVAMYYVFFSIIKGYILFLHFLKIVNYYSYHCILILLYIMFVYTSFVSLIHVSIFIFLCYIYHLYFYLTHYTICFVNIYSTYKFIYLNIRFFKYSIYLSKKC